MSKIKKFIDPLITKENLGEVYDTLDKSNVKAVNNFAIKRYWMVLI